MSYGISQDVQIVYVRYFKNANVARRSIINFQYMEISTEMAMRKKDFEHPLYLSPTKGKQ